MNQTQSKAEKKPKTKVDKSKVSELPSLEEIMKGVKDFSAEILSEGEDDFGFPYRIPFNHVGLQHITGGIIGGKMAEISGDSQTGKSYVLYELISNVQKMGGYAKLYDYERALEPAYAKIAGIDLKSKTVAKDYDPDMGYFFTSAIKFITNIREFEKLHKRPKAPILIGVDSFPGMQTKVDLKNMKEGKEMRGYAAMQKNALFSQEIARFVQFIGDNDATVVFLNQTRIDHSIEYGDKTVTPAENTVKFWCTQRIRGKLSKKIVKIVPSIEHDKAKIQIGSSVIWETIKNRSVKPFQKILVKFRYSSGLDAYSGLDELLYSHEKITTATTTKTREGETVKKPIKGFRLNSEDKPFYYSIKDLVEAHPQLLVPAWTGTYDDGEGTEEDDAKSADEVGAE